MGKRLNTKEVKTIARAFAALARMDPRFSDTTKENSYAVAKRGSVLKSST
jgi:hypothetical protein